MCSVDVDAPADDVWVAVTDWRRQGEWVIGTSVTPTYQDGIGVGGRIEAFTGARPLGFLDVMEITRWDPPRRCQVHHLGRVVRGTAAFEVTPLPGGRTRVTWAEWLEPPLGRLGEVALVVGRPLVAAGVRLSLRRLARWVVRREQGAR